ncbi:MAG: uracil phosphoribosyltransferase [Bacteroidales bacterium]|nr:uracil phosphoribosyltransferase [Bacteroidales bacterium]
MIHNFRDQQSIVNNYIAEMRDAHVQKDAMRFRINMERFGAMVGYEISKSLDFQNTEVQTPLGIAETAQCISPIVLATILRAGLPLNNGLLSTFDKAENAFVTAYRKYHSDNEFEIKVEYMSSPNLEGKILILSDPMLATGSSMVMSYKALLKYGKPKHTHIVSILASKEGVDYVRRHINSSDFSLWTGDIDDELTVQSYIVPGLGDAGDLAFGKKE